MDSAHSEGILGLALLLGAILIAAAAVAQLRLPRSIKGLAFGALALRVVGSIAYYALTQAVYRGGDYVLYYQYGIEYADRMTRSDFSMFVNSNEWLGGQWSSTQFVCFCAGIIAALFGSNILTAFIVFSLLAFVGLIGFVLAFHRSFPDVPVERYALWVWLFPSLWFWSAALGKDALLLCGLGVGVLGFVGRGGRINWLLLAIGILLALAVRPQVAAVVVLAMVLAQWTATARRWTALNTLQSLALAVAGLLTMHFAMSSVGSGATVEGVQEYMEGRAAVADRGRTAVDEITPGLSSIHIALVNILLRPFPWEAKSATTLIASVEIWGVWIIAFIKRRNILAALREWRSSRLLSFSLILIPLYSVALGMVVVNMGIIARQRIFLFPFLFLLFEAKSRAATMITSSKVRDLAQRRGLLVAGKAGGFRPLPRKR
jgi:hypothetical protein